MNILAKRLQGAMPDVHPPIPDSHPAVQRRHLLRGLLAAPLLGLMPRSFGAGGLEQFYKFNIKPEVFLFEVFGADTPVAQSIAVSGVPALIQPLPQRLRYWRANGRTAWIFDEIGKEGYLPTTAGFVVREASIEQAKVLIYRESRGEQVGQPSFLQQLAGARDTGAALSKPVDNISGATYSVKMMQRMARTALVLDKLAV